MWRICARVVLGCLGVGSIGGCSTDVVTAPQPSGGLEDARTPSRCREYVDHTACCAHATDDEEPCAWLAEEPGLPGRCIGIDENCADGTVECASGETCRVYSSTTQKAGLCLSAGYAILDWGVCVSE